MMLYINEEIYINIMYINKHIKNFQNIHIYLTYSTPYKNPTMFG